MRAGHPRNQRQECVVLSAWSLPWHVALATVVIELTSQYDETQEVSLTVTKVYTLSSKYYHI